MPLKALLNESPFYAWDLDESKRKLDFSCPHCPDTLIPIIPQENIIKHFRHKNNEAHGEPETREHLDGKQFIVECLKNVGINAEPEVKVDGHICDVMARHNGVEAPIELQCSPMAAGEFVDRVNTYGDSSCWVLGTHYYKHANNFKIVIKRYVEDDYSNLTYNKRYEIQRLLKLEKEIRTRQPLLYLNNRKFHLASWKYRLHTEVLGWYNLKQVHEGHFLKLIRDVTKAKA